MPRSVVQEHHATNHRLDLRPERNTTLVSWAIPEGMPADTKNRPAVRVGDHDLSHPGAVDGTPVEGVHGATRKSIRDSGTNGAEEFGDGVVIAGLRGRLDGRYAIFGAGENGLVHETKPGA